ncbi:MAG TPA: hypothetical protein VJB65_01125, partial [Patescibacteria group bacterium]|nr:hypothetical protein [Patescibacteria group bacterium]
MSERTVRKYFSDHRPGSLAPEDERATEVVAAVQEPLRRLRNVGGGKAMKLGEKSTAELRILQNVQNEEPKLQTVENTPTAPKSRWSRFIGGVQQCVHAFREQGLVAGINTTRAQYGEAKKELVTSTNETLAKAATAYVERYEAMRDSETGEVPSSLFRRLQRGIEAVRSSITLKSSFELAARVALQPLEFSAQMVFKQFGVDIAVRQADYVATRRQYADRNISEKNIETDALIFASAVREQFQKLSEIQKQLPITAENLSSEEAKQQQEKQRKARIEEGRQYGYRYFLGACEVD